MAVYLENALIITTTVSLKAYSNMMNGMKKLKFQKSQEKVDNWNRFFR
jgi:hypothetical protein